MGTLKEAIERHLMTAPPVITPTEPAWGRPQPHLSPPPPLPRATGRLAPGGPGGLIQASRTQPASPGPDVADEGEGHIPDRKRGRDKKP